MGDANPIRTLGDYSKPSHEGYRNTIKLPEGNNVFSLRDQANNWLERLPAGSIATWEDLTTHFLAHFFPPGRTAKLHNDILMFQQHQGESISKAWTRFKDLLQKVPHHGIDLWLQALLEDLALYDNESWNDPRDFAKPVKAISLPQDVPMVPTTLGIAWKIPNKPVLNMHPRVPMKQEVSGLVSNFMASQDARLSKFEVDFEQQQNKMTDKIDTILKAITYRIVGALPSNTVKNPKLNVNSTTSVLYARSYPMEYPQCSSEIYNLINAIKTCSNQHNENDQSKDKTLMVNKVGKPKSKEPGQTLEDIFKDLHLTYRFLKF
ncbi:zinc finger, CCHC-type containing protein [Tanacetum coccineum]